MSTAANPLWRMVTQTEAILFVGLCARSEKPGSSAATTGHGQKPRGAAPCPHVITKRVLDEIAQAKRRVGSAPKRPPWSVVMSGSSRLLAASLFCEPKG